MSGPQSATPKRILLAEDEAAVASFLLAALESEGYAVDHAADGAAAIEAFDPARHDLVLSDFHMPIADGADLVRHVRRLAPGFPFIGLSGSGVGEEFASFGVDAFLQKPIALEELLTTVGRIIHRHPTPAERRGFPRKPIDLPVTLADEKGSWTGRMIDISQDGLLVETTPSVEAGGRVVAGGAYRAYFRRPSGQPADLEVLATHRPAGDGRLGFRFGSLSRWQQEAVFEVLGS